MNMLLATALVGSLLGFTLLWPDGVLAALLGAQLGAIALAFLMSPVLALRRIKVERTPSAGFKLLSKVRSGENRS
jgi:purine-cytosine permease-like protein